jgi:hypothetical protein
MEGYLTKTALIPQVRMVLKLMLSNYTPFGYELGQGIFQKTGILVKKGLALPTR